MLGLAAITDDFRVSVWIDKQSAKPLVLGESSEIPWESNDVYGMALVESVAVSPNDCSVFVGTCWEPVSGITYFQKADSDEWLELYGRLPSVSADGKFLARVVYEELVISKTNQPDRTDLVIGLPKADVATIYRAQWINNDEIALSGFTKDSAKVWVARIGDNTVHEAVTISSSVNWNSEDMMRVGLVGVDETGNIITQNVNQGKGIVEFRYPESFEIFSTDSLKENVLTYSINQSRSAMVTGAGVLTTWFGNGDPKALDGKFAWAG